MTPRSPRHLSPLDGRSGSAASDAGMTLVEVLVALGLFSLVGSLLLGLALSTSTVAQDTQRVVSLDENARLALERMVRELRQASRVDVRPADQLPDGTFTSFSITATFEEPTAAVPMPEPEVLTYTWRTDAADTLPSTLTLSRVSPLPEGPSVLASDVTGFSVELRSSRWEFDGAIPGEPADSVTTWQEIDHALGNDDIPTFDELLMIDRLHIDMTLDDGDSRRPFSTEVFLRNAEVPR